MTKPMSESDKMEETKRKFREALERKKSTQHRSEESGKGADAVHGSETAGPTQKMFRRKSGG